MNSSILFTATLCAVASAQGRTFDGLQAPAPTPGAALASFESGSASLASLDDPRPNPYAAAVAQAQDTDYTMRSLFSQAHGQFMLKRERLDPMIEFRGQALPRQEIQHEAGNFRMLSFGADIELPFMVSTDGYITVGGYFDDRRYYAKNMNANGKGFNDENLYAAGAKIGFGVFLDDNLLLETLATPGYWSDFDSTLTHHDFKAYGKVLFTYRADQDLFFKFGARYNDVYAEANVLPYLGVSWQPTESFRIDVLLPEKLELSLWPTPDLGFLLGTEIQGGQYRVRNGFPNHDEQADVHVQEVVVYTGLQWRFTEFTSLLARVGSAVAGDYKLDDGDPATKPINGSLEPGVFVEASFGIDF